MEDPQQNGIEDGQTAANRPNCEECRNNPWKYKCPGCGLRSCGLPCVKAHKERTQCTGKRNRAEFVPISQFDDNWLVSDYNFLEEALRMTESAKQSRAPLGDIRHFPSRPRKAFQNQAKNRNTKLLFLPKGMSKNETNRSYYNKWRKCIYWTVELQFHSTDVIFVDHGVDEHASLRSILEKHQTIGKIIIEYPVIHVVLPAHSIPFEVLKHLDRVPEKVVKSSNVDEMGYQKLEDLIHLEGVPFREEEIEEGEFEGFRGPNTVTEKVGKPSIVDKTENQILHDLVHREALPFREEKFEEGEFEVFRDFDSVLEKLVQPLSLDKIEDQNFDDLVHQEGIPFKENYIEEGEFQDFKDLDPVPEKVVKPQTVDKMEGQNLDDLVHQEGVPFRKEEIDEVEFELFRDLYPVPEKIVKPATIDELEGQNLDDLVHLESVRFREGEIEEGEFVSNWDFDEDYICR